jgi:hypothetical protein
MTTLTGPALSVEQLREAYRWARDRAAVVDVLGSCEVVTVLAAHGGAGASTVALAMAEALAADRPTRLLDVSEPLLSGLTCASSTELGPEGSGWLLGRRGDLQIDRRHPGTTPGDVVPRPRPPQTGEVVVIDQGTHPLGDWEAAARHAGQVLVVAAATAPGLQAAHRLLEHHPKSVLALVAGPSRPGRRGVAGDDGEQSDRVVRVPYLRRLPGIGLTGDPLDPRLLAAGARVQQLLGLTGWTAGTRGPIRERTGEGEER